MSPTLRVTDIPKGEPPSSSPLARTNQRVDYDPPLRGRRLTLRVGGKKYENIT